VRRFTPSSMGCVCFKVFAMVCAAVYMRERALAGGRV